MLQCCLSEKLQPEGTGGFHMLPGDFSGSIAVLLFDGVDQGLVLIQGFHPAIPCGEGGPGCVDEVRGQSFQQVPEDRVVGAVPDGGMELQIRGDFGVVIRVLELPVSLQQGFQPHQIRELSGSGCLACCLFLQEDAHVIDLDDLLWVHLGNLEASGYPFKEPFLL